MIFVHGLVSFVTQEAGWMPMRYRWETKQSSPVNRRKAATVSSPCLSSKFKRQLFHPCLVSIFEKSSSWYVGYIINVNLLCPTVIRQYRTFLKVHRKKNSFEWTPASTYWCLEKKNHFYGLASTQFQDSVVSKTMLRSVKHSFLIRIESN